MGTLEVKRCFLRTYFIFIFLCFFSTTPDLFAQEAAAGHLESGGFYTHPSFQRQANIQNDDLYKASQADPVAFWAECAQELDWFKKWETVLKWNPPDARWFEGGVLNACYNCLDRHLETKGDRIAFFWCSETGEEKAVTYADLHGDVCALANGLKSLGVVKGDRVAIYMPMIPEAAASMLACARIGAVHSVVFGGIGAGALKEKIKDADAKLLITADGGYRRGKIVPYKQTADEILDDCSSLEHVIVIKRVGNQVSLRPTRDIWFHELVENLPSYCPCEPMEAEDLLFILYTSGTTGKAKGIIHTTGGYMVGVHNTFKWVFDRKPEDIYFCTADIGWITGHSYVVYGPMSNGVTQIIYEGAPDFPEKDQFWKIVEKYRATIFYTAPTLIRTFMKWGKQWVDQHDISSLRLLGSIGETLNPEAWHWYHEHVGHQKCPIVDTWFQTETGALVISPIPGLTLLKPGSVCSPLPGMQVNIFTEEGDESDLGLLAITTPFPSMLRGIFKSPSRYASVYWNKWGGRFYYAGDAARRDDDGYIWIHGRSDEVIKTAGHRIGTAEVENALIQHQVVSETAVVGVNHPIKGQAIVAFVVLKKGEEETEGLEGILKQGVSSYLGSYAKPDVLVFVRELPKTRSGKILRRLLRNLIEDAMIGDISTLENQWVLDELKSKAREVQEKMQPL